MVLKKSRNSALKQKQSKNQIHMNCRTDTNQLVVFETWLQNPLSQNQTANGNTNTTLMAVFETCPKSAHRLWFQKPKPETYEWIQRHHNVSEDSLVIQNEDSVPTCYLHPVNKGETFLPYTCIESQNGIIDFEKN